MYKENLDFANENYIYPIYFGLYIQRSRALYRQRTAHFTNAKRHWGKKIKKNSERGGERARELGWPAHERKKWVGSGKKNEEDEREKERGNSKLPEGFQALAN